MQPIYKAPFYVLIQRRRNFVMEAKGTLCKNLVECYLLFRIYIRGFPNWSIDLISKLHTRVRFWFLGCNTLRKSIHHEDVLTGLVDLRVGNVASILAGMSLEPDSNS